MFLKKKLHLFLIWTVLVVLVVSIVSYCKLRTKSYEGKEISFQAERGYYIFIEGERDEILVPFKARSLSPFMIDKNGPSYYLSSWWDSGQEFDSHDKQYQHWTFLNYAWWDGPEEGLRSMESGIKWRIVEGSSVINFDFNYDTPITINYFPWKSTIEKTVSTNLLIGLAVWSVLFVHLLIFEFKKEWKKN